MKRILSFVYWYLPALGIQYIGSILTYPHIEGWYKGLDKVFWTPPDWVFGPVWTFLYIIMTVCIWRIYQKPKTKDHRRAYLLYAIQLILNGLWTYLFFSQQKIFLAMIDLILLALILSALLRIFWKIDSFSGWLWTLYLVWVLLACTLNIGIYILN